MKQRRLHHETAAALLGEAAARAQLWTDLEPVLDEELMRLPGKYQDPLVLCCLEGKTQAEAARLLGWPTGTVAARISRGREQLRQRLSKRGIVVSSTLLTSLLASEASAVAMPVHLLEPAWASRCLMNSEALQPIVNAVLTSQRWQQLSSTGMFWGMGAVCLSLAVGGSWWLLRDNTMSVSTASVPVAVQQNQRYVALPRDPQAVVLQLTKRHMVTQAPSLTVSLLADGTIKLKRLDAERSLKLSQQEVQQLLQLAIHDMQLLSFDGDKLWNTFHQEFEFDGNLRAPEDTTETVIDLNTATQSRNITWKQLSSTEAWFYETPAVRHLAELSRRLTSYVLVEEAGGREAVAIVCDKLNKRLRSTYPKKLPFQPHHLVNFKSASGTSPASYSFSVGSKFIDAHFYAANCQVDAQGQLMLGTIIPGPSEKPPRFPTRDKSKDKAADK